MKIKTLTSAVRVLLLMLLVPATCALAQEPRSVHHWAARYFVPV